MPPPETITNKTSVSLRYARGSTTYILPSLGVWLPSTAPYVPVPRGVSVGVAVARPEFCSSCSTRKKNGRFAFYDQAFLASPAASSETGHGATLTPSCTREYGPAERSLERGGGWTRANEQRPERRRSVVRCVVVSEGAIVPATGAEQSVR